MLKNEINDLFRDIEAEQKVYLENLFRNLPDYVADSAGIRHLEKHREFICAGQGCEQVSIIVKGSARGVELQAGGNLYIFGEFPAGSILGDFEVFGELYIFRVSIYTLEDCEILVIPADIYRRWMQEDINALYLRIREIMRKLTYQLSDERARLALECRDRLIIFITDRCGAEGIERKYKLRMTQTEIADCLGAAVRTVQRSIMRLEKDGLISIESGKICVTPGQLMQLNEIRTKRLYGI